MINKTLIDLELARMVEASYSNNVHTTDSSFLQMPLFSIALALKAKTIVELGVRDGGTTLPLLLAAHVNGGFLNSVDINDTDWRCPPELISNWQFHIKDSLSFLKEWPSEKVIDLVFIDDWHAYGHVKKELELLDSRISSKSVILLHDTMYAQWQPHYHCDLTLKDGQWAHGSPYRAVAELDQNFWEFSTLPVNNGLTMLRKKYSNKYHS